MKPTKTKVLLDEIHVSIFVPSKLTKAELAKIRKFTKSLDDRIKMMIIIAMIPAKLDGKDITIKISR